MAGKSSTFRIELLENKILVGGSMYEWVAGWVNGGSKSGFKDCLQQSKGTYLKTNVINLRTGIST